MEILQIIAIGIMIALLGKHVSREHKKTRKESQEIKTRLAQVRKDLNKIEEQTEYMCDCQC